MTNEEMWQAVLGEIELTLSKAQFITWFKNTFVHTIEQDCIIVNVPNIFTKEWLENKYKKTLLNSIRKYKPQVNRISCLINTGEKPPKKIDSVADSPMPSVKYPASASPIREIESASIKPNTNFSPAYQQPTTNAPLTHSQIFSNYQESHLNSRYNFDNYVVGSNNELAYAACRAVSDSPGNNYNPLFLYGGVGLGKTHLLQSTGNRILKNHPHFKIKYISTERFANELVDAIQNNQAKEFKNKYIMLDALILDDVQFLSKKEKTQEEFFHIFESLYQLKKQIILSSDRPPKSIPTLEDRLRSRFEGGMMADISKPDLETRIAIINSKLTEKDLELSGEIINYLAENIYHNVRELEGALNKIIAIVQLRNSMPSVDEVAEMTKDVVSSNRKQNMTPKKILDAVADYFNIKTEEISSKGRKRTLVRPRQLAVYMIRSEINLSFPEIGNLIGGRDHSTAIYAYDKMEQELKQNPLMSDAIKIIKDKLIDY